MEKRFQKVLVFVGGFFLLIFDFLLVFVLGVFSDQKKEKISEEEQKWIYMILSILGVIFILLILLTLKK